MQDTTCTFSLKPVKPEQVLDIIKAVKNSRSTGLDNLDTYILKLLAPNILPALTHIINLSIRDGVFPAVWKKAKIVPLLKKGDALDPKISQSWDAEPGTCAQLGLLTAGSLLCVARRINTQQFQIR